MIEPVADPPTEIPPAGFLQVVEIEEPTVTGWRYVVHNVVAHPLLVLCPPIGERLHDWTLR